MSAPKIAEPELQLVREKEKGVVEEIDISKKITLQGYQYCHFCFSYYLNVQNILLNHIIQMVLKFPYKDKAQWVLCEKEKTELILYGILTMMKEHHLRTGVDKIEFICQPHYS